MVDPGMAHPYLAMDMSGANIPESYLCLEDVAFSLLLHLSLV
jgi:hypothetical protein